MACFASPAPPRPRGRRLIGAIEGSMLALLRHLCGDSPVPVLNEWQLTIARTMARLALCYLDTGRNLIKTARRLNVHRNTVVYRVAKIKRLLGRPLGERPFATQAALTLAAERAGG